MDKLVDVVVKEEPLDDHQEQHQEQLDQESAEDKVSLDADKELLDNNVEPAALTKGPESWEALFQWPQSGWTRALQLVGEGCKKKVKLYITTEYSGMGNAELAVELVEKALRVANPQVQLDIVYHSACDSNETCRVRWGMRRN